MSQMFLVIKGKLSDAVNEALQRRIEIRVDGVSIVNDEIYCYSPIAYKDAIIKWYSKDIGTTFPAKPGDLLWYSERP